MCETTGRRASSNWEDVEISPVNEHDGIFAGEQDILWMASEAVEELKKEAHGVCNDITLDSS
jgi:hypothetical protein